jgi:hypothetical protein
VRAYVGKDGSPAAYSKDNVAYKPPVFLKVNPNGVDENDFVFILGYPGRTMRHLPAKFLDYQNAHELPLVSSTYDWVINYQLKLGEKDDALRIAYASNIKSLANVTKNYKGKMQGLKRTSIMEDKKAVETKLQNFIDANADLKKMYGGTMKEINEIYDNMIDNADRELWITMLFRFSNSFRAAGLVNAYQVGYNNAADDKKAEFMEKELAKLKLQIANTYSLHNSQMEKDFLAKMLKDGLKFSGNQQVKFLAEEFKTEQEIDKFLAKDFMKSEYYSLEYLNKVLDGGHKKVMKMKGEFMEVAVEGETAYRDVLKTRNERSARLNTLMPNYVNAKMAMQQADFMPDANSTLRLTYGHVKAYKPEDGVFHKPITTLGGVIEKAEWGEDYMVPKEIKELYAKKDFGNYIHPTLKDVPVAILYDLDTTGGNSGSPIMNDKGELIGVNFDRAFTATINDFAWNESYSRSIGVDIRYVLWVVDKVAKADFLIKELGVKK